MTTTMSANPRETRTTTARHRGDFFEIDRSARTRADHISTPAQPRVHAVGDPLTGGDVYAIVVTGLVYGLVIGLVLAFLGWAVGSNPVVLGAASGILGVVAAVIVITLLFVVGASIGDLLDGRKTRQPT